MSDIPEFYGNPSDLDFNPEYVFNLKEQNKSLLTQLEAANKVIEAAKDVSLAQSGIFEVYKGCFTTRESTLSALDEALQEYKNTRR